MPNYKELYFQLASRVADVVEALIEAQQEAEDSLLEDQPEIYLVDFRKGEPE